MLIVTAGRDHTVSATASSLFADRSGAASHLVIVDARHELLMEQNDYRGRFWSAFDSFVG
jgi:lysophospholipase